jgi:V/A-type H+-transporting ATPase subunit E
MKTLDTGFDKVQKICDVLRQETLEPAKQEGQKIIADAKKEAEQILKDARQQGEKLMADTRRALEQERNVFQSSLTQASKQSLEALRQAIEHQLFDEELHNLAIHHTTNPQVVAKLIESIVHAIEKEGLAADIAAIIPTSVSAKEVNALLASNILNKLKENSVTVGDISGGVKVRLENKKMTLDISDVEIESLLKRHLRKDFRTRMFGKDI